MTATLTIDNNGAIYLPKSFLEKFHLKPGATLLAYVSDEGLALRPDDEMEGSKASLVDRDGFLVFTGTEPFDAVEVVMAARADRNDAISPRRTP
ncbi:MAG: AbrB/MazE/SpoVT family DNA-binding domain-containing protein [Verrucomicrobia bacterium]|nr:AbrB/MazE/SpoVT family DNA-binding domain-containing protein [Verrucomicrobiota bacterium]